jgi:hypothetical protein
MKKIIFIQAGPPHLFITTGIFFAFVLKKKYDLILIANSDYTHKQWYSKMLSISIFKDIVTLPAKNTLKGHFLTSQLIHLAILNYQPDAVLMHSEFFVDNLYLLHWLKKIRPKCARYYFQPGRMGVNVDNNNKDRFSDRLITLMIGFKIPLCLKGFMGLFLKARDFFSFFINCKFLPYLITGNTFHPPVNYITGKIFKNSLKLSDSKGIHFQYTELEADAARKHGAANICVVNHPAFGREKAILDLFDNLNFYDDCCIILPTYGFVSSMIRGGLSPDVVTKKISDLWIQAITEFKILFPGYSFRLKLHPSSKDDNVWKNIINSINYHHPDIEIINPLIPAEILIITSKVIIGDTSSALWWASLLRNKKVVSLNVFDYEDGDALQAYDELDITHINFIDEISSMDSSFSTKDFKFKNKIERIIEETIL